MASFGYNIFQTLFIGVSRGFGFVLFAHITSIHAVIEFGKTGEHKINGKVIDPKQAQPHNSLPSSQHKLFVGGVNHEHHSLEDIQKIKIRPRCIIVNFEISTVNIYFLF